MDNLYKHMKHILDKLELQSGKLDAYNKFLFVESIYRLLDFLSSVHLMHYFERNSFHESFYFMLTNDDGGNKNWI